MADDFDADNDADLDRFQAMKDKTRDLLREPLREALRLYGFKPVVAELADITASIAISVGEVSMPMFLLFMRRSYDFVTLLRVKRARDASREWN